LDAGADTGSCASRVFDRAAPTSEGKTSFTDDAIHEGKIKNITFKQDYRCLDGESKEERCTLEGVLTGASHITFSYVR
jgi:hypothetical protein